MGISVKDKTHFSGLEELPKIEVIVPYMCMDNKDITANLGSKGNTHGFPDKFLMEKDSAFADEK